MSDLAITKAAAWAWLQHGPGPLDSSNRETGHTRAQRVHRPSRYKLEVDKLKAQTLDVSCLLDRYEMETISKHINGYLEVNKHEARSEKKSGMKIKNKSNTGKGFRGIWLMNGIVCVPREDEVVDLVREKSVGVVAEASGVKMIRPRRRHRPTAIPRPTIGLK